MKKIIRTIAAALVAAALVAGTAGCVSYAERPAETCSVSDKDRSTDKDGSSVYRVYTDCGVFSVEDRMFLGKFNSADTYAAIEVGKTYLITSVGVRNGFFSMFPNIVEAVEVPA